MIRLTHYGDPSSLDNGLRSMTVPSSNIHLHGLTCEQLPVDVCPCTCPINVNENVKQVILFHRIILAKFPIPDSNNVN